LFISAIDIDQEESMELNLCGTQAGNFTSTVKCHVDYSTEPIYVHVKANFEVIVWISVDIMLSFV
jgi:hypothetical protein